MKNSYCSLPPDSNTTIDDLSSSNTALQYAITRSKLAHVAFPDAKVKMRPDPSRRSQRMLGVNFAPELFSCQGTTYTTLYTCLHCFCLILWLLLFLQMLICPNPFSMRCKMPQ